MLAKSVKRYMELMNIGLKTKDRTAKPIGVNVNYCDPGHIVYLRVEPLPVDLTQPALCYEGVHERERAITIMEPSESCSAMYNVDHLRKIIDNLAPGTTIKLTIGDDYPLKIEGLLDVETRVTAYVAPSIEPE